MAKMHANVAAEAEKNVATMKATPLNQTNNPAMKVDPISHKTSMEGGVPHNNTSTVTAERAEANAKHFERLAAGSKRPEDKADCLAKAAQHRASVKK